MRRFYVSMTWDDWPEGGSYGTVVEAEDSSQAEELVRREMAASRAESVNITAEEDPDGDFTAEAYLRDLGDEWCVVDCFDIDDFIAQHRRPA